jgi:hypothetical protein
MERAKPWYIFILLFVFGFPFVTQLSVYPWVPFQMFTQSPAQSSARLLVLGKTHNWQIYNPEASFGETMEWPMMLKQSEKQAASFLQKVATTRQAGRYTAMQFIKINAEHDTLVLASCSIE